MGRLAIESRTPVTRAPDLDAECIQVGVIRGAWSDTPLVVEALEQGLVRPRDQ